MWNFAALEYKKNKQMSTYNEDGGGGGEREVIGLFGYFGHEFMCVGRGIN